MFKNNFVEFQLGLRCQNQFCGVSIRAGKFKNNFVEYQSGLRC